MEPLSTALSKPLYWSAHALEKTLIPPEESEEGLSRKATLALKSGKALVLLIPGIISLPLSALSYIPYSLSQLGRKVEVKPPREASIPAALEFIGTATAEKQLRPSEGEDTWTKVISENVKKQVHVSRKDELEMVKNLVASGLTAYRFSIEWSRIQNADGSFNAEEIEKVKAFVRDLKKEGIQTITLTTHHFTDPLWLKNGFEDPTAPEKFATYFFKVFDEFSSGDAKVDHIATINEPNVYSWMGWGFPQEEMRYPPHANDPYRVGQVLKNVLTAHMYCMRAIKEHPNRQNVMVGFTHQALRFTEYHKGTSPIEGGACRFMDEVHQAVVRFIKTGELVYQLPIFANIVKRIANKGEKIADCIFLQNYGSPALCFSPTLSCDPRGWVDSVPFPGEEMHDFHFRIDPEDLLTSLRECRDANEDLPIIISENGIAVRETEEGNRKRQMYMLGAMQSVAQAVEEGIKLKGYYHWSLVDNYEWMRNNHDIRFGLHYQKEEGGYAIKEGAKPWLRSVRAWHDHKSLP